LNIWRRNRK